MNLSLRSIRRNIAALGVVALIASMLVVQGVAFAGSAVNTYSDVNGGEWYEADVDWGLDNGVLDSSQAYFRAGDNASRAEFFTMVARGAGIPEGTCDETLFPDLDASHWACGWVTGMADAGIVAGDGPSSTTPGYVRPDDPINRAEAGKVTVEGYGLTGTGTLGSDVWTDSEVGAWYDSYMGIAYDNCVFQGVGGGNTVEPGRNIVRAEAIAVVNRGANPTSDCAVVTPAGALTVSLDGSTPDGVSIPQNGANIPYSVFAFTASNDEDVNVNQVIISREGLGLPSDFTNLKLYVDGVQKGSEKTVNSTTNTATFALSSDPIVVPAGKTVLVEVRAEMSGVSGSENQLCIELADDVTGVGATSGGAVDVSGSFAICGNTMVTTSATVGTLTYTVSQPSTADINIGDTDVIMTKVKMDMATEDVEVNRITFKQKGSAGEADFANVSLWMSGSQYADSSYATWDGDFLTFDLTELPIAIAKGNSKTVELHTDVVGGLASTAAFDIYRDWHIEGTGQVYGYGVNVEEDGSSATPSNRDIVGGNVAFSLSSNNPVTGDVKKGANDFEFTRFNISTAGDGITVRKLSLTVNGTDYNDIDDVKIWTQDAFGDWYVVAGPNDITGGALPQTVSFTDTFDVPAATTQEFMVTADIANAATLNDTYDIDVADVTDASNTELEYLSDGTSIDVTSGDVTGGMLNGNVMTVKVPTLTVSLAATPGDKSYVRNTTDKDLVAFDMQASTADDLRVTSVVVTCTAGGAGDCATAFQSLYLYEKDGSTLTVLDGPRSMSALTSPTTDGTATFSLNHTVAAGSTARLLVRSDISSGATSAPYAFTIEAAGDISAEDTDSSAATVSASSWPVGTRTVTVAANGTIANQNVTDTALKARMVASLSQGEPVLKIRFDADQLEAWYVKKLNFDLAAGTDDMISKIYVNYTDQNGDPQTASGTISSSTVQFSGLNVYVPAGGNQTIDISLDMGEVAVGGASAGDLVQIKFDGTTAGEFEAIGASSAAVDNAVTDITSKELRLAKSFPVVARNDLSTALANGEVSIYETTIAADSSADIAIKQLYFDVSLSTSVTLSDLKLFKDGVLISDSDDVDIVDEADASVEPGGGGTADDIVIVQWSDSTLAGEDIISAGTSTTYTLKATAANATSGESVSTSLKYDTTASVGDITNATAGLDLAAADQAFVWSDLSGDSATGIHNSTIDGSSDDYLNGYLVDGLSSAGAQILSL